MADKIKSLYAGTVPATNTAVYTVPTGKYAVVKSMVLCNPNSVDIVFTLIIGGMYLSYGHLIKANSTLSINDLDIPILAGTVILMSSTSGNPLTTYISGFERDYVQSEYMYSMITGSQTTGIGTGNTEFMIKSIVLCGNLAGGYATVTVKVAGQDVISAYKMKEKDALILPFLNIYMPKQSTISVTITGTAYFGIILEKVVQ